MTTHHPLMVIRPASSASIAARQLKSLRTLRIETTLRPRETIMTPYVPRLLGDPRFPRYVVVRRGTGKGRFWTGRGWSRLLREALLFADIDDVNRTIARLYSDLLRRSSQGDPDS